MSVQKLALKIRDAARELARDNDIDLAKVEATGTGGFILKKDVELAMKQAADSSADVESATTSDDSSTDEQRQSPADRFAAFAAEATEANAADVLDTKVTGLVLVELNDQDTVIANVADDGFVKFVYANSGKLGGMLAKRPGKLFPLLHEAAGREMPKRGGKASEKTDKGPSPKSSVLTPADVLRQAADQSSQKIEQELAKTQKYHAYQLNELAEAMDSWDGAWINEISRRRKGEEGLAFFQVIMPSNRDNRPEMPIAGLILYQEEQFTFVSVVAQDAKNARSIRDWHKQLVGETFSFNRDGKKLGPWANAIRLAAQLEGSSDPLSVPESEAYDVLRSADTSEETSNEVAEQTDAVEEETVEAVAPAESDEVVETAADEVVVADTSVEEVVASTESDEVVETETDKVVETDASDEDTSDDSGVDPALEVDLAELLERGIGSKIR